MAESILQSIKKLRGVAPDDTAFDPDIIVAINTAFMILNQLGVGPTTPFAIEDDTATWDEFLPNTSTDTVKTYVSLRVSLLFDPPSNSFLVDLINNQLDMLEFRLLIEEERSHLPEPTLPESYVQ